MKHLILIGGGHAHMTALLNLQDYVRTGHQVTVVTPSPYQYYSGMGPGMLSGIYQPREIRFHISKMAEDRGGVFIEDKVIRVSPRERSCLLASGKHLHYDVASFNIGSEVPLGTFAQPDERIIPVKPVVNLYRARRLVLDELSAGELRIAVVGGGPSGVEVAANLWKLVGDNGGRACITVMDGGKIMAGHPARVRRLVLKSLTSRGIRCMEQSRVRSVEKRKLLLEDGSSVSYDFVFIAVGVKPPGLFQNSDLPTGQDGGLLVNEYLRSVDYPNLFGGGDCISLEGHRLAKVGVHAVRQNQVLHHNLLAALAGSKMRSFDPTGRYMLILNMGNGKGILWKNGWVLNGSISFKIKDFVDRRFVKRFQTSGEPADPMETV